MPITLVFSSRESSAGWPARAAALLALIVLPLAGKAQVTVAERRATLPDGTPYGIRIPSNWNGTLVRDLDYAGRMDNPLGRYLTGKGYGVAGTQRHRLRVFQYDPAREIANLDRVLDIVEREFRKPSRVIQFGCSGGGHVSLAVGEDFSSRVHGVIAQGAHTPVWLMNNFLDGWFTLKALLAPDLPVVDLPFLNAAANAHGVEGEIPTRWRAAIQQAQESPEGRARIALAFTLGQWPAWGSPVVPLPDYGDVHALQHAMYHTLYDRFSANPGGEARIMFESAANGEQLSWNDGVDARALFANGHDAYRSAVETLYRAAGLDLQGDLGRINALARVKASPHALAFWNTPGRTVKGVPKVPVLRMHEIGDFQVPMAIVAGYTDLIQANGKADLYRTAFVRAPTHCGFSVAETAAAIEVMNRRLDTGTWPSTEPEALNALAGTLGGGTATRFIAPGPYLPRKYNRVWTP